MSTRVHRPVPHSEGLFPRRSSEDLTPVPDMLAVLAGHPGASHHNRASDSATPPPSRPGLKFVSKAKRPAIPQIVLESSTPGVSRALSCGTQNSSRRRIASRRGRPGASSAQREAAFRVRHVRGARGGRARCVGAFLLLTPPVEASPQRLKPASSYPGLETLLHLLLHADVVGGGGGGRMLDPPPPGSGPGMAWGPEACGRFSAPSDKGGGARTCPRPAEIECRGTLSTPLTLFHQTRDPDGHTPPSLSVLGSKFHALDPQCHERPGVKVGKYARRGREVARSRRGRNPARCMTPAARPSSCLPAVPPNPPGVLRRPP